MQTILRVLKGYLAMTVVYLFFLFLAYGFPTFSEGGLIPQLLSLAIRNIAACFVAVLPLTSVILLPLFVWRACDNNTLCIGIKPGDVQWVLPPSAKAERNKRNVIGWSAATAHELETMEPSELQAYLDSMNPYSGGLIEELLAQLEKLENLPGKHKQAEQLRERIKSIRMLPVECETERQQLMVNGLLERADHAVQSVREPPED